MSVLYKLTNHAVVFGNRQLILFLSYFQSHFDSNFKYFFDLSAVSIFVFSNRANMRVNDLMNHFLSVYSPINSSNSSCIRLDNPSKKSKTPSVESEPSLFSSRYSWSSLLISSKVFFCRLFVQDQRDFCLIPLKF